MRKIQISFDFLVIVIFAFIIFLEMFQVYALESMSARITESRISALRVGSRIARAINEVLKANGTNAVVTIPESLDTGDTYYVSVKASGRRVDVFWPISTQNRSVGVAILTSNVTQLNKSKSAGSGQSTINITNSDGFVKVYSELMCGNEICEAGENCENCAADCTCYCGDGLCTGAAGEDCNTCVVDCDCEAPASICCPEYTEAHGVCVTREQMCNP
ncbi:hypothetical protein H0N99_00390 [Candidatus Micrarchaeota archaeon]|nr:hypothetical protein [Candidatus Micrarchaeota archaeon]